MIRALALALAAAASAQPQQRPIEVPPLPVRASYAVRTKGGACESAELARQLRYRFQTIVDEDDPAPDLRIQCEETDEALLLHVGRRNRRGIHESEIKNDAAPDEFRRAYLAAQDAAFDHGVVSAALEAYVANNSELANTGAEAFTRGDWNQAARRFARALESDRKPAPLYMSLYRTHAALGRRASARWYLAAYLRVSRKKAAKLTDEEARPLARVRKRDEDPAEAERLYKVYAALASDGKREALDRLKEVVAAYPWHEDSYRLLAQAYRDVRWKRLSDIWLQRAEFARGLNENEDLFREIENRVADAR